MVEVRIRHIDEIDSVSFTKCEFGKQLDVIEEIKSCGVYSDGDYQPYHDHQYIIDKGKCVLEIIIGK